MKRPKLVFRVRWWHYAIATVFAMPFVAVGLALSLLIIGTIVGIPLMMLGCWPLYKLHSISVWWNMQQEQAYIEYDEKGNVAEKPWETSRFIGEDDSLILGEDVIVI